MYRNTPTLRNKLVKTVMDPPKRNFSFFEGKGFYPCKRCYACFRTKYPKEKVFEFRPQVTILLSKLKILLAVIQKALCIVLNVVAVYNILEGQKGCSGLELKNIYRTLKRDMINTVSQDILTSTIRETQLI